MLKVLTMTSWVYSSMEGARTKHNRMISHIIIFKSFTLESHEQMTKVKIQCILQILEFTN